MQDSSDRVVYWEFPDVSLAKDADFITTIFDRVIQYIKASYVSFTLVPR